MSWGDLYADSLAIGLRCSGKALQLFKDVQIGMEAWAHTGKKAIGLSTITWLGKRKEGSFQL